MTASSAALWRMAAATRSRWRLLGASIGLAAGAVLAGVGLLATSGYLISRAAQRPDILALGVAIAAVRSLAIARAALRYGERLVSHELAFRTLADLRRRFFERLVPLVPGGLPGVGRAHLLSRFVADVDRLQDVYLRAIAPVAVALVAGSASVLIAFVMAPAAGVVLAAGLLAGGVLVPVLTRAAARAAGRRQARDRAELTTTIVEAAGGAADIAMAGRERDWIQRADRQGARLAAIQRRDALAGGLAAGLMTAVTGLTAAGVALVAIPAVRHGELAGVLLAAVILLAMAAFEAVRPLAAAAASIDACAAAAGRIEDVLAARQPVGDPPAPVELPAAGALELRDVRFRYDDGGPWLLDGADLRLAPGRAIALVGASGSGKTTLAELLVRFRDPVAGNVALGGVAVREADQDDLRAAVCLGAQDAHLFAGTLAENLALARPGASPADLERALTRVGLGPWLASLPDGLATEVGEHGAKVSGGQRRRIAAARLLLSPARFLVADEPAAHLDAGGAAALMRELADEARAGRGVLVIAHEAHGLEFFDEILTLRGGRLERG
ncbi:MAG TPA: thiol reductant ABC exporter subunit CydC [Solirubrobacteraceae bacterium]